MKKDFSKSWKSSKQPRKQRKYLAKAPLHLRRKFLSANLAKDLRKKHGRRNIEIRKNDKVKIMRGKFRGKQGKVLKVNSKKQRAYVEGMQVKKHDGSKANVSIAISNLQIIELNLDDKMRIKQSSLLKKEASEMEKENRKEKLKEENKGKDK